MFVKTKIAGACLLLACAASSAQTIDEISELNRQAAIAEARSKIELAKKAGGGSGTSASSGPTPSMSPASPLPAGSAGAPAAPAARPTWKMVPAKKAPPTPPALIAIYGVGGSLIAELSDEGREGRYREGDKTPGGWTVSRIDRRNVDVTRPGRGKESAKAEKVALAFGTKIEVPKEPVSAPREQMPGVHSVSPLPLPPSSFQPNR